MPSFGFGDVPAGSDVTHLIRTLESVRRNPSALQAIEEATTSCIQWGDVLRQLMPDAKPFFIRKPNVNIRPEDLNRIAQELHEGNAVLVSVKFPGSTNHVFTIEARANGNARILHAWQGKHQLRVEEVMPIDEMVGYLKRLPELDWVNNKAELQKIRHKLWGADHAEVPDIGTSSKRRVSYEMLFKGKPDRPLTSPANRQRLTSLSSDLSEWHSAWSPDSVSEWRSAASSPSEMEVVEAQPNRGGISVRWGAGVGAGLGFVFGAGGVLLVGLIKGEHIDYAEVGLGGLKGGVVGGIGGGAGAAVAKNAVPAFARIGVSVVRANAVAGVAMFGVLAIWDVIEWKMNEITEVELRKRLAAGAGGAAGSIAGGATAGVGMGIWLGPVGAAVGVVIGGIAGGIAGTFGGMAIDKAIWDESEDAVMNSYEYFGWHDVKRNTRPLKSADEIGRAYDKKIREKPKKAKEEDWHKFCLAHLMVLLPAMYPEFKKMMQLSNKLKEEKSSTLSAIGTAFYEYLYQE